MKPLRILLLNDRLSFRDSAATLLSTYEGVEIVGQVASAAEAFEKLKGDTPDLALMDISMPHMSGLETSERINTLPMHRAVLVTSHDGDEYRAAAKAARCDGFVVKERFLEEMSSPVAEHSELTVKTKPAKSAPERSACS